MNSFNRIVILQRRAVGRTHLKTIIESNMKLNRANYVFNIEGDFLYLEDLNLGGRSLTNDIEAVLTELSELNDVDLTTFKIIYCDSEGNWDGVVWKGKNRSVDFIALNTTDFETAKLRIHERSKY